MLIGTIAILAYYGLLQSGLRYSRALIILSAVSLTVALLVLHEIMFRAGIYKQRSGDEILKTSVIIGTQESYEETLETLRDVNDSPLVLGRISIEGDSSDVIGTLAELGPLLSTTGAKEVIFCAEDISYSTIIQKMEECGDGYEYKIHLKGSKSFIGSNSSHTSGDIYTVNKRYNIALFAEKRNKRIVDISFAIVFILLSPLLLLAGKGRYFLYNSMQVLSGRKTWIGYGEGHEGLPSIRDGIAPCYHMIQGYHPGRIVTRRMNEDHALYYHATSDINLIIKNINFLGKKKP